MANETTTASVTHVVPAEVISDRVMQFAVDDMVVAPLARQERLDPYTGKTFNIPKLIKDSGEDVTTEGTTTLSNNEFTTTETSMTVAQVGILYELTKFMLRTQKMGLGFANTVAKVAGTALAEMIDDDLCALFTSFSTSVGSTGVNATTANCVEAIGQARLLNMKDPLAWVFHPQQLLDVTTDINSTNASALFTGTANQAVVKASMAQAADFLGAPVYRTTLVDAVNANADRCGALITQGEAAPERASIALTVLWLAELDEILDVAKVTHKMAFTSAYAVANTGASDNGVKVVTDL